MDKKTNLIEVWTKLNSKKQLFIYKNIETIIIIIADAIANNFDEKNRKKYFLILINTIRKYTMYEIAVAIAAPEYPYFNIKIKFKIMFIKAVTIDINPISLNLFW